MRAMPRAWFVALVLLLVAAAAAAQDKIGWNVSACVASGNLTYDANATGFLRSIPRLTSVDLLVSVSQLNGEGVTGLTTANFTVITQAKTPAGTASIPLTVEAVTDLADQIPGGYSVRVSGDGSVLSGCLLSPAHVLLRASRSKPISAYRLPKRIIVESGQIVF